jgi:tetrahydromethanopterin S-methyltransferase subunit A
MTDPSYVAGDPDSPVAICTLSSTALCDDLAASPIAQRVSIIGPLETENLGIERMMTTLLRTPRIRWLVLCGEETRGRYQGQAVQALFSGGVDADGTIVGARGRRARLHQLTADHVDAIRRQVRLVDLIGSRDFGTISQAVDAAIADDPGIFGEPVELPLPEPILVPQRAFRLKEHDPAGFFVIQVDRAGGQLMLEHYDNDGGLMHRIAGPDAESLGVALEEWGLLTRLDHAAYMGRELTRAELALRHGLPYRQDEPS